ncbi:MAG: LLM class flavin-dependent oxidoreductase [Candidatus Dormibacterales bacterium]
MAERSTRFGVALKNFTTSAEIPDMDGIRDYTVEAERLGFTSAWVWDHILLGTRRPFPFLESLSTLAALAPSTRAISLGTGVLVPPLRNPVVLAKVLSSVDHISKGRLVVGIAAGWYEKEFEACGVPYSERGRVFVESVEIMRRFWSEEAVEGAVGRYVFKRASMLPKPYQRPGPPLLFGGYVDAVLRRVGRLADGWLTYFYTPESFARSWARIRAYAQEAGRDPDTLRNVNQLPICVASSFEEADRRVRAFVADYFDVAPWSESNVESSIRGRPEDCARQLQAQIDAGVEHLVLVPCDYSTEQLRAIAGEVLPLLQAARDEVAP